MPRLDVPEEEMDGFGFGEAALSAELLTQLGVEDAAGDEEDEEEARPRGRAKGGGKRGNVLNEQGQGKPKAKAKGKAHAKSMKKGMVSCRGRRRQFDGVLRPEQRLLRRAV